MTTRPQAAKGLFSKKRWSTLSEQQQAVVKWVLEETGHLELLARAGCGKTFTLMQVVDAVVELIPGQDVALMAFNKAIAEEIKAKLELKKYDWRTAQAGTCHSFGFGAWRKVAAGVKVDDKKVASILDDLKTRTYIQAGDHYSNSNTAKTETGLRKFSVLDQCAGTIEKLVSLGKQRAIGHLTNLADVNPWYEIWDHYDLENDLTELFNADEIIDAAREVYQLSLNMCREVIDFDDMILAPLYFKARFWPKDWILLDESQDTNPARRALALAMMKPRTGRIIFVGDDKQAINGFAGADNDAMAVMKKQLNAKTLHLTVTRRCGKEIVKLAQRLVPDITAHESNPAGVVRTTAYEQLVNEKLSKDDAILCRNTAPLVDTAYTLISKGIACRVEGREIGNGLIRLAQRWKVKTLDKLLSKLEDYEARQTAKYMSKGQEEKLDRLMDQVNCLRVIINRQLSINKHTIEEMVEDIKQMFGNTPDSEQPKVLTLSTIHKSKGREWKRVFALGRQKFLPSPYAKKDWMLEQEFHLEYVMITRAIQEFIDVPYDAAKETK